jgi:hypothetical protein
MDTGENDVNMRLLALLCLRVLIDPKAYKTTNYMSFLSSIFNILWCIQ